MTYPGIARVTQSITKVGRSSVEMALAIERTDEPGLLYATGRSVIVWFDYVANKAQPWPETVRAVIA
jgi:acyl-CoA thioester hydrolase